MLSVLVASRDQSAVTAIGQALSGKYHLEYVASRAACLEKFRARRYEFTFVDTALLFPDNTPAGPSNSASALAPFREAFPAAPVIVLAPQERIREAVELVKAGADNYLSCPIAPQEVSFVVNSMEEIRQIESELHHLRNQFWREDLRDLVRTNSPVMRAALDKIQSVSPTKTTVLLGGETGTGKSQMAKLIHSHSNRPQGPFISVHCGSIPETLVESELFGHERGAFTDAIQRKKGLFEAASGGTVFLDEIGELPLILQAKLLGVLERRRFRRLGGNRDIEAQVRIVAATNIDPKAAIAQKRFREDLYYRLNVFPIHIPPLRERPEDVIALAKLFLLRFTRQFHKGFQDIEARAMGFLTAYPWPGNVRELRNVMERICIMHDDAELGTAHLPQEIVGNRITSPVIDIPEAVLDIESVVDEVTRQLIGRAMEKAGGNTAQAARLLGIPRGTLRYKLKKYSFEVNDLSDDEDPAA